MTYFRERSPPPVSESTILKITQIPTVLSKYSVLLTFPWYFFSCVSPRLAGTIDINEGDPFVRSKAFLKMSGWNSNGRSDRTRLGGGWRLGSITKWVGGKLLNVYYVLMIIVKQSCDL